MRKARKQQIKEMFVLKLGLYLLFFMSNNSLLYDEETLHNIVKTK